MIRFILSLISLLLVAIATLVVLSNKQELALDMDVLFDGQIVLPIWAWLCAFIALGFVLGAVFAWWQGGGLRKRHRQLKRELKQAQGELAAKTQEQDAPSRSLIVAKKLGKA